MWQWIPPDADRIAAVGDLPKKWALAYRRRNPRGNWGAWPDPGAAREAFAEGEGRLDALLLGPDAVGEGAGGQGLGQWARLLAPEGVLLAVVPNARYRGNLEGLLHAPARPRPARWPNPLAPGAVKVQAEAAGLIVRDLRPGPADEADWSGPVAEGLIAAARAAGADPAEFRAWAGSPYLLLRAVPAAARPTVWLQGMTLKPVGAVNDKRMQEPLGFLDTLPRVRTRIQEQGADLTFGGDADSKVFIWQRPILKRPDDLATLRRIHDRGYLSVVEFDDDPEHWPEIAASDYLTFRGVHAVQTSTETLAAYLRQFNPNVRVFANQMAAIPSEPPIRTEGPVRLFFGALNREADWRPLVPELNRILRAKGGAVAVQVVHDRAFFDTLDTEHKAYEPTCGYDRYLALLQSCDIGLLPLADTPFNRLKSDLKFIEHGASGCVALANPVVYADSLRDGETGVLFGGAADFGARLEGLIDDGDRRRAIAGAAYAYVRDERMLGSHYRQRLGWYEELLADKADLDRQLAARVPEAIGSSD